MHMICFAFLPSVIICFVFACCFFGCCCPRLRVCCGIPFCPVLFSFRISSVNSCFHTPLRWCSVLIGSGLFCSALFCFGLRWLDSWCPRLCCSAMLFCSVILLRCYCVLSVAVLCCSVLFCPVLVGSVLSCALLFYPMLLCALLSYAAMCSCVLCCSCPCLSLCFKYVLCYFVFVCCMFLLSVQLDVVQLCFVLLYYAMWCSVLCCYDVNCALLFCCVLSCSVLFLVLLCFSAMCYPGKTHFGAANAISLGNRHVGRSQG